MIRLESHSESPEFQRAFLAVAYLAGARGEALLKALPAPCSQARELAARLGSGDRAERARRLASELEPIGRRLSSLGLGS
jgi:hypothetical protein